MRNATERVRLLPAVTALAIGMVTGATLGGWSAPAGAETVLRIGTVLAPTDPMGQGLEKFKTDVEAATKGEVVIDVFHNSQLGDTTEMLDQARAGANVGTVTDVARLSSFVPSLAIMSAPSCSTPTIRPTRSPCRRTIWAGATSWRRRPGS